MKIDYDCIRDVLITLEERLTLEDDLSYNEIPLINFIHFQELSQYEKKQIAYCVYKLAEAQYIEAGQLHLSSRRSYYSIKCITYKGHEFISNTANPSVWKKTTNIAKQIGVFSMPILSQIATNVISNIINSANTSVQQPPLCTL